jgi:hypothetical protein
MRNRDLERRLRAAERKAGSQPFQLARSKWIETGRWPGGRIGSVILDLEQTLAELHAATIGLGRSPFQGHEIDAEVHDAASIRLRAVQCAKKGDAEAIEYLRTLARERHGFPRQASPR